MQILKSTRFAFGCLAVMLLLAAPPADAQSTSAKVIDPKPFGIDLPAGTVLPGESRTVTTDDAEGEPAVGRLHVRIGDGAVVMLPDGQLVVRPAGRFELTERPFEPIDKETLTAKVAAEFPGFKTKTTNHYLYVYNTSDEFALATSRILETMLPGVKGYAEINKLPVHNPPVPLVVVMFKTEDEFQQHRRMPEGVVAYYHTLSNRVFMYEQSRLAEVRPDLAIQQSISTIAHEGGHQILHNIGVQQRLSVWPMWLSEGLAEFFAPTSTGQRLKYKGAGQVNDLRMFELEQYVKSEASQTPDGELIEHTVVAARLTSTGYASAWALTHHLAKNKRTEFNALLREASQFGPLEGAIDVTAPGIVRSNREMFVKHFGDDFTALETRLIAHLKKQPYSDPFAGQPHFVATLLAGDMRRPQRSVETFHSPQLARKWLDECVARLPAEQQAAAQTGMRTFQNRPQAEAFAQQWLRGR